MKHTIAITLALLVLLPFVSAAINAGTGAPPVEAERASSVQVLNFGNNAMICVNCPALTTTGEPGLMQATNAERFPRIVCKGDTPCVIYTGLKYSGMYNADDFSPEDQPFAIVAEGNYQKGKPITKGNLNFALEDGQIAVDAETKKMYDIENSKKIILQNAKAYFDNAPAELTENPEVIGTLWKIRGLDKRAPNQLIGEMSIPLKKGDTITFKGIFRDDATAEYSLEKPVLNIGRFTDNEDDSTAEDEDAEDWLDELDDKFLDSSKDRSELQICNKKFVNYYAGSSFELKANEGRCEITEYQLNTELFEEDDADDNKLFPYNCGDIVFEAVGGNAKNLYCNQEDIHNVLLSCGKDENDQICTGLQGKSKFKVRIEPGAFEVDNTQSYMFQSIKEVTSEEQKAYHFLTGGLKIRTHPQSDTPNRYDVIGWPATTGEASGIAPDGKSNAEREIVVTYKDNTAAGVNTLWLSFDRKVNRVRGNQIFSYRLLSSAYKAVLGEGLHQINLIYPEALDVAGNNMIKITEAKTRGTTRDNIALLGATAEERIDLSRAFIHEYLVTPSDIAAETAEAVTSTPSGTVGKETTLGEYAYRHCFGTDAPEFRGAAREATERIARAMLETNPQLTASEDILDTPIPAGASLSLPGTTTEYRLNNNIVRVRVNTQGCFGLTSPAITGEQCMEKSGAVVKCVPKSRQSQCTTVYQEGEGVKGCQENNVCCEVRTTQAGEYCILPEAGRAFMPNGAKCSARCGSEVTPYDYEKIAVERVTTPCAEGLKCCKSARAAAPSTAAPAAVRDDSRCGGTCGFQTATTKCMKEGIDIGFKTNKCLSKPDENYVCCLGTIEETSAQAAAAEEEIEPIATPQAAEGASSLPNARTRRISYTINECEIAGGSCKEGVGRCASTEEYIGSCLEVDAEYSCCKPVA